MTARGPVVVVGSINVDRSARLGGLPRPGETVEGFELTVRPGGKSANQAVAAARLGGDVRLVAAVGDDAVGSAVLASLAAEGVDVSGVRALRDVPTGEALILVDDAGENCIVVIPGANACLTPQALVEDMLADAGVVLLCLEVPDDVVLEAARRAHEARVPVLLNASPVRAVAPELLSLVDVLVLNEHELRAFADVADPADWTSDELVDACGVDSVVVTLGARGATLFRRGRAPAHEPAPAVPVADTTGCGDAFLGVLAHELAVGSALPEALQLGVAAGAAAATRRGAQDSYATRAELDALIAEMSDRPPTDARAQQADA